MTRRILIILTTALVGIFPIRSVTAEEPGTFTLKQIASKETKRGNLVRWMATAKRANGQPFTFSLELLLKPPQNRNAIRFSEGAILRDEGQDGSWFLGELSDLLAAGKGETCDSSQVDRLSFSTAILGTSLSEEEGDDLIAGKFTSTKPGDWSCFKLFLANGEAEVFLSIDPVAGQGEFSLKDEDYGNPVIRELAKVFCPEHR